MTVYAGGELFTSAALQCCTHRGREGRTEKREGGSERKREREREEGREGGKRERERERGREGGKRERERITYSRHGESVEGEGGARKEEETGGERNHLLSRKLSWNINIIDTNKRNDAHVILNLSSMRSKHQRSVFITILRSAEAPACVAMQTPQLFCRQSSGCFVSVHCQVQLGPI